MKHIIYTLALGCALGLVSCGPRETRSFETIDYVRQIAADSTCAPSRSIRALDPASTRGAITVIGEPEVRLLIINDPDCALI